MLAEREDFVTAASAPNTVLTSVPSFFKSCFRRQGMVEALTIERRSRRRFGAFGRGALSIIVRLPPNLTARRNVPNARE